VGKQNRCFHWKEKQECTCFPTTEAAPPISAEASHRK
jgi:hypothetical protein